MIGAGAAIATLLLIGQSGQDPFEQQPQCAVLLNCTRYGLPPVLEKPTAPPMRNSPMPVPPEPMRNAPDPLRTGRPVPVPEGNPATWVTSDDYPAEALAAGQEGRVIVELMIGPDGRARTCGLRVSSSSPSLDATTCLSLLVRARYHPAIDENGGLRLAPAVRRVRWQLPVESAQPDAGASPMAIVSPPSTVDQALSVTEVLPVSEVPSPPPQTPESAPIEMTPPRILAEVGALAQPSDYGPAPGGLPQVLPARPGGYVVWFLRVDVAASGAVAGCSVIAGSPFPALDQQVCDRYQAQARFMPAVSAAGVPVESFVYAYWAMHMAQ